MDLGAPLTRLDDFLLDRVFQRLSDRVGERPSAYDLGLSLQLGAVVLELAADATLLAIGQLGWGAALWDGLSCACGLWLYRFMQRQRGLVRPGAPNPLRHIYRTIRLLALAFAAWSVGEIATAEASGVPAAAFNALSNVAFVAGMYLVSCQPRPPGFRRAAPKAAGRRAESFG